MAFLQDCQDVVRKGIMKVVIEFHAYMKYEKRLNATFKHSLGGDKSLTWYQLLMNVQKVNLERVSGILVKLAMEKAFDHVNWEFL